MVGRHKASGRHEIKLQDPQDIFFSKPEFSS